MTMTSAHRSLVWVAMALAIGLGGPALGQKMPGRIPLGEASISGRVIDRHTKQPIANVLITLSAPTVPPPDAILVTASDAGGKYTFDGIGNGTYQLKANHPGYAETHFGASAERVIGGAVIRISGKEKSANNDFSLVRAGLLSGRITGPDGRPMTGVMVSLWLLDGVGGYSLSGRLIARSNQNGEYVVSQVPEGTYRVHATWSDVISARTSSSTLYFPGTRIGSEAMGVDVGPGAAVRNIDIAMPLEELLTMSGQMLRSTSGGHIRAELRASDGTSREVRVAEEGAFELRLRPGRYTLAARAEGHDGLEVASLSVDLRTDMTGLLMTLASAGSISGRVVTEDGTLLNDRLYVLAVLSDGTREIDHERRDRVEVDASGAFRLTGLFGKRVLRLVGLSEEWSVERVLLGENPVTVLSLDGSVSIENVTITLKRQ